jgi:hypothetical protein
MVLWKESLNSFGKHFNQCQQNEQLPLNFVSDLWQVGDSLHVLWVSSTNKTDCHDITEILLNVALNSTNLNQTIT